MLHASKQVAWACSTQTSRIISPAGDPIICTPSQANQLMGTSPGTTTTITVLRHHGARPSLLYSLRHAGLLGVRLEETDV